MKDQKNVAIKIFWSRKENIMKALHLLYVTYLNLSYCVVDLFGEAIYFMYMVF